MKDECKGAAAKASLSPTAVSAARAKSSFFFLELQKHVDEHENQKTYLFISIRSNQLPLSCDSRESAFFFFSRIDASVSCLNGGVEQTGVES